MANLFWKRLKKEDKIFAFLFWATRYCNHSLREIQADVKNILGFTTHRRTLCAFFDQLVAQGFLIKHYRFRKNRYGEYTDAHQRNYYELTVRGRAYMEALVFFAMFGEMTENTVAPELKIFGTIIKTPKLFMARDWITLKRDNSLSGIYIKKLYHLECSPYSISPKKKECQAQGKFSIEIINFAFKWMLFVKYSFESEPPDHKDHTVLLLPSSQPLHQEYLHPWIRKASLRKKSLKQNIHRDLFQQFNFGSQFDAATDISKFFWAKQPEKNIEKCLRLIQKKQDKGYKFRSFEKFLYHLIQGEGKPFYAMKAKLFRAALDGNKTRLDDGADTRDIVDKMRQLEKDTGQKIDEKTLLEIMRHSTHMLKRALEAVEYRMKGITPKDNRQGEEQVVAEGRPIYETRLVTKKFTVYSPRTGRDEVRERKEREQVLVGYASSPKDRTRKRMLRSHKAIRSWVGLLIYALKLGSIEAINEKFFKKRLG